MAFQPAPGIAQVEVRMVLDSQRVENVLHFRNSSPITAGEVALLAQTVRVSWQDNMLPLMGTGVQLNSVYARSLEAAIAPADESFPATAKFGLISNPMLPSNVSWCVKLTTGLTGRSGRGRQYVIGLTEGQVTNNLIGQAVADDWVTAYGQLAQDASDAGWQLVVLSRQQAGVTLANAVGYDVTGIGYIDRVIDSQRRRLPQRGN